MTVNVKRERDRCVSKRLGKRLDIHAVLQRQGSVCMASIVESDLRQAHVKHDLLEVLVHGACGDRSPIVTSENELVPV